jgi:tetratricopeptide (TPR) repeat protein
MVLQGLDPAAEIEAAVENAERTVELFPGFPWSQILQGYVWLIKAELAWTIGESVDEWLALAREAFVAGLSGSADLHSEARAGLSAAHVLEARTVLESGRSPETSLRKARTELDAVLAADPENVDVLIAEIEIEILEARWRMRRGASPAVVFDRALSNTENLQQVAPGKADGFLVLAELHLWRARWSIGRGDGAARILEDGLNAVSRALEINPGLGDAELIRAELELERSTVSTDAGQADEARRKALVALDRALELNVFLKRQIGDVRRAHTLTD